MAEKILIASDSTSDLGAELIERYGIKILPLGITVGGKNYTDGVDIDPDMMLIIAGAFARCGIFVRVLFIISKSVAGTLQILL